MDKKISAILIVGDSRPRGQAALDALYAQTIPEAMEIIVFDLQNHPHPPLVTREQITTRYILARNEMDWARARAEGVRCASTPIVAFIEDHCIVEPGWAHALVEAHHGPWACVGYAFTNPNPELYLARSVLMAEYGRWMHPVPAGPDHILPCGNVAYKRDLLLSLGDELEVLLTPDYALHQRLTQMGHSLYVASNARISHSSFAQLSNVVNASFIFCCILAANRARSQSWSKGKRIAYAIATPVISPTIAVLRLAVSLRRRRELWLSALMALPVILVKALSSALGEAFGYVAREGNWKDKFSHLELHMERIPAR